MLTEKAKQQEEMLVEYDESEAQQKDLESEVDLLRAQVDSMKDELRVSILICELTWTNDVIHGISFVAAAHNLLSLLFVDGTPYVLVMILLLSVDSEFFLSFTLNL